MNTMKILHWKKPLRIYETIPAERMNGIKGVGFELHDGSDYDRTI